MARLLLAAIGIALAAPALAADPANRYPAPGMMEQTCPASRDGLWTLDPHVLQNDWAWLCRYRAENGGIDPAMPPRVVFIGDSITEGWVGADPGLFAQGFLGRGISGQASPQLLARFWQDVVALHPRVVHIMAGTNDIAGNLGPTTPGAYQNAVRAMVDIAQANGIVVIIGSILPTARFDWAPQHQPAPWVARLNGWLKEFAASKGLVYADYHAALAGPGGELRTEYGPDGVHPNAAGYAVMRPIAERAIAEAERMAGRVSAPAR